MTFSLVLVPILAFAGAALDYSRATDARTFLQAAADAAALSAVNLSALPLTDDQAEDRARSVFGSAAASVKYATNVTVKIKVKQQAQRRTAKVSFDADVPTTLLGLVGMRKIAIGGDSGSAGTPPIYMDFYLLLDNTPSMGVAATTSDISRMENLTVAAGKEKCAFACHDLSDYGNNYKLAKSNGVTMRIDVVRSATQQLMDKATKTALVPGQFRAAVHTFGDSCVTPGAREIAPLTSNLSAVKTNAGAVDLMTIPFQNYNNDQCTDYDGALAAMNAAIPAPGDGANASSAQKVLFFVSDGVADAAYPLTCSRPTTNGRCQEPIKTATCDQIKARGVKIAVLYTTYLPLPSNGWYNTWIAPFAGSIGTRMQGCASPGLYFEVGPNQGIAEAMARLFDAAVSQAKLSS